MSVNFTTPKTRIKTAIACAAVIGLTLWCLTWQSPLVTPPPRPLLSPEAELARMDLILSISSYGDNTNISGVLTQTVEAADRTGWKYIISERLAQNIGMAWKPPAWGKLVPRETLVGPKVTQLMIMMGPPYSPASDAQLRRGEYLLTFTLLTGDRHLQEVDYNLPLDGLQDPKFLLYRRNLQWLMMPDFSEFLRQTKAVALDTHQTPLARFVAVKCIRMRLFQTWCRFNTADIYKVDANEKQRRKFEYAREQKAVGRIITELEASPGLPNVAHTAISSMFLENDTDMPSIFNGTNNLQ